MKDISLHLLELAINSIDSGASKVNIEITLDNGNCQLIVQDNGKGMSDTLITKCLDKGFSTKNGSGYGLYELNKDVLENSGDIHIASKEGEGTRVYAKILNATHLKGLADSIAVILDDRVDVTLQVTNGANAYTFDTHQIKRTLNGVSIQSPSVIVAIKKHINEKILEIGGAKL